VSTLWLRGAMVFVLVLVVGAIVVAVLTTRGGVDLLSEDSPEGTVQRYLLALEDGDYEAAYAYLSEDLRVRCSLDEFVKSASYTEVQDSEITLEETRTFDGRALVRASVSVFEPGFPFGEGEQSYERTFELRAEDGAWRMTEPAWWCPPYRLP
jgi:hypothetical protein